jgi:hypothetical protein
MGTMPFTPFHFGPGAAIKAVMPRHFSFTVFCFAQIITDFETGYYLVHGEYPLHRLFHTYLGASAVAVFCILVGQPLCQLALRIWNRWQNAPFKRYFYTSDRIPMMSATVGAFIGTYSHVFLDSIMHSDVEPFSPFSAQNPLHHIVGWLTLHTLCLVLGIVGTLWLSARKKTG